MNYLAILVSAAVSIVLGMIWYAPTVFGKAWMVLSGITPEAMAAMKPKMVKSYSLMAITSLITAYVLAKFITDLGAGDAWSGLVIGLWAWLGFIAATMLGVVLWEGKPFKLYAINAGFYLVNFAIMGAIIGMWR